MATITVTRLNPTTFQVEVRDGSSQTLHRVTAKPADLQRLGGLDRSPEGVIEQSFRFLLEREPKEAILRSFDLTTIERYFPDYPQIIRGRLT